MFIFNTFIQLQTIFSRIAACLLVADATVRSGPRLYAAKKRRKNKFKILLFLAKKAAESAF